MPIDRIVRLNTVLDRTGLSRSTIYRKIADGTFPAQIRISVNGAGWKADGRKRRRCVPLSEKSFSRRGPKRGEVHAELRGELFGILELVRGEDYQRTGEVMLTANACLRNHNIQYIGLLTRST